MRDAQAHWNRRDEVENADNREGWHPAQILGRVQDSAGMGEFLTKRTVGWIVLDRESIRVSGAGRNRLKIHTGREAATMNMRLDDKQLDGQRQKRDQDNQGVRASEVTWQIAAMLP
jgi:hypothetical protein